MLNKSNPNYFYTEDGTRIFYNANFTQDEFDPEKGLIIFIYGLVCSNLHWQDQIKYFEEKGYQVLIHDFRAHFSSSGSEQIEKCTFKNISSDLYQLVHKLQSKRNLLLAHSMGVNVALEFTRRYPDLVNSLALLSGTVLPPQDIMFNSNIADITIPYIKFLNKKFDKIFSFVWKNAYMNPIVRKVILHGGFNPETVNDSFIAKYLKKIGELEPQLFYQLIEQMKKHDIINHLEQIDVPTLIIGGDNDKVIPTKHQYILSRYIPNSDLYIIRKGSHVPQVDFPDLINDRISAFIEKKLLIGKKL